MVSAGMKLIKYLMFAFNLIFAMIGLALVTIGALFQSYFKDYDLFMDERLVTLPILMIIVGVVVFIVASFGCCGAIMELRCVVVTFSVFLIVIFVLELAIGITAYVLKDDIENSIKEKLNEKVQLYPTNEDVQKAWNIAQHDLHCCGVLKPEDWEPIFHNDTLPWSCCSPMSNASIIVNFEENQCTIHAVIPSEDNTETSGVYQTGCLPAIITAIKHNSVILGGVGIGFAVIQILGIIFSCCLARSIRREYETV